MRSAEVPRVDIVMEVGSINESVTVNAAASLLNTENVVSAYVVPAEVLKEQSGVMKRTVYLLQYMPGVVGVLGQAGFHITGQAQNDIGASLDGVTSKSPYTGVVNQVDGVVQGSMDAMEEVKVLTTGVSAEYGHTAGGSMKMVYKSGTNSLHGSFDDRYLPGNWTHRSIPDAVPDARERAVVLRDLRSRRAAARWSSRSSTTAGTRPSGCPITPSTTSTPSTTGRARCRRRRCSTATSHSREAAGGGLPIYNPFSSPGERHVDARSPARQYRSEKPDGSRGDEVPLSGYLAEAQPRPARQSRTGPSNNLTAVESCRCLHRDRWDEKIDHQFSSNQKIFFRYSHYHNRGQNGDDFADSKFNVEPVSLRRPTTSTASSISRSIISPVMFNEFRVGYNRRATSNPPRPDAASMASAFRA